jgi:hypothetical protein
MALPARSLLAVALLALACGQKGNGTKIAGMTGDGATLPPGQEAGPTGTRGGGGAFGGGNDPDGAASDAEVPTGDAPAAAADGALDLARDRPRDTNLTPIDGVTLVPDSASPADLSGDPCAGLCDMYETDYKAALVRARVCNPSGKLQCQMTAATGLHCAGCKVWVTSTVELADIRAQWMSAGCQSCKVLCPLIACRALTTGVCHSKMLAAQDPNDPGARVLPPPVVTGTCLDQSDPVPF